MESLIKFNENEIRYIRAMKMDKLELLKQDILNRVEFYKESKNSTCLEYYVLKRILKKLNNLDEKAFEKLMIGGMSNVAS